jgi:hypothetical protein
MTSTFSHPESRRLLRDAAWVVALLALLWSPLPEIVLGHWLQISNDARPETGRAHDRLDLLQESDSQTVTRSTVVEREKQESSRVATLTQLRVYLMRNAELDMSLEGFRGLYGSLSPWQQNQLISPDDLTELARRGLAAVGVARQGAHARFTFLDVNHNRLAGAEADLLQLQLLPMGLAQVAPQDTAEALADPAASEIRSRQEEGALEAGHRELLRQLRQLPGVGVDRVWRAGGEILLLEIRTGGSRQWLRPSSTDLTLVPHRRASRGEGRA